MAIRAARSRNREPKATTSSNTATSENSKAEVQVTSDLGKEPEDFKPPELVNVSQSEYDIYIGVPNNGHYGTWNCPRKFKNEPDALRKYYEACLNNQTLISKLPSLTGKRLGCKCDETMACHGYVLVELWKQFVGGSLQVPEQHMFLDQGHHEPPLVEYIPNWVPNHKEVFLALEEKLPFDVRESILPSGKVQRDNRATVHFTLDDSERGVSVHAGTNNKESVPQELLEMVERLDATNPDWKITRILCNRYDTGRQGIGWHTDREEIGRGPIFSVSLGSARVKQFRRGGSPNNPVLFQHELQPGALVIMWPPCQSQYFHCIPKEPTSFLPRINLTFRCSKRDEL